MLFLCPGCGGEGEDGILPMDEAVVRVTRLAGSKSKLARDIAPYDEAIAWHEYHVDKIIAGEVRGSPSKIRVAHWTVLQGRDVPQSVAVGEQSEIRIRPFRHFPGLGSIAASDDLDTVIEEIPLFADVAPLLKGSAVKRSRWDYGGTFSNQMQLYWKLRGQLKTVVLGNSHAAKDIAPGLLSWGQNKTYPEVINLGAAGSNVSLQCLIAQDYVETLPQIKRVIWVTSLRLFNHERDWGRKERDFLASPAYAYERAHPEEFAPPKDSWRLLGAQEVKPDDDHFIDSWGWESRSTSHVPERAAELAAYVERTVQPQGFEFDEKSWAIFEATVRRMSAKGIEVILVVPPLHPIFAEKKVADPDGTSQSGAAATVRRLEELAGRVKGVSFRDFNLSGKNDFVSQEFYDLDHLAARGAERFTKMLADWIVPTGAPQ